MSDKGCNDLPSFLRLALSLDAEKPLGLGAMLLRYAKSWGQEVAAGQAREQVMRAALTEEASIYMENDPEDGPPEHVTDALRVPSDDTALEAAIQCGIAEFLERTGQYVTNDASRKNALAAERERIAKHFEDRAYLGSGYQLAIEIRALGEQP